MEGRESDVKKLKSIEVKKECLQLMLRLEGVVRRELGHGQKWSNVLLYHYHHHPLNTVTHVCGWLV